MVKKPARKPHPRKVSAERRGHDDQLKWDEERVGRLYQLFLDAPAATLRIITDTWNEKYPGEAISESMVLHVSSKHDFRAHLFLDRPDKLNPYLKAQARIKAMARVVKTEAPNASVDFIKGLQGAIFSKLLMELELITIDTPEKADHMLAITERLVRIEHQKRGIGVLDRETETPAMENARPSWRDLLDAERAKQH